MQFKYPELLYALFLLIIPIIIHLFQLRRFQKVEFTNVKFLKTVKLQTRKSAQLKKWLTLLTRMLLLACVCIAFAQPFIPKTEDFNDRQETVIYLDNSFSMQANGDNGSLLNEAIQDLITTLPETERLSLFTNDRTFKNTTLKALKDDLIQLPFSSEQLSYEAAFLKAKDLFSNTETATKNLILVSDFQIQGGTLNIKSDSTLQTKLVKPQSRLLSNISIDSVYMTDATSETMNLKVLLSGKTKATESVTVSLFNDDKLLAKTAVDIDNEAETTFTIPNNQTINGKLEISDVGLNYDNSFYFNINEKPKIKVLAINDQSEATFLKRIYSEDEFSFTSYDTNALNFNLIPDQNLVILNELESISSALGSALKTFKSDGGTILIIPSVNSNLNTYNQLFNQLSISNFLSFKTSDKRVTSINYSHPLLANAFYAQVTNFQYPRVDMSYKFSSPSKGVLMYEDGSPFLVGSSRTFAFSSALNSDNSNFKNSQLIVPVLYNMGLQSLKLSKLYYTVGTPNKIAIATVLGQDDILSLSDKASSVIPLQNTYSTSVVLETDDYPQATGIFKVKNKDRVLQHLSFNYDRAESNLNYHDLNTIEGASIDSSLATAITTVKSNANVNALWKWFVIFALVFLIIEMLILKYLK